MDLRSVDLNLLAVLEALLDECHVSRAASRIGLSQSATSSALERCRHLFRDRLLERRRGSMRLTPTAEALREPLKAALDQLRDVLKLKEAEVDRARRTVHLIMADALGGLLSAPLYRELSRTAPGVDIVLHPWSGGVHALEALRKGDIDLAISSLPQGGETEVHRETFLEGAYRVVMRDGHPAAADFGIERWLAFPHMIVASGEAREPLDDQLEAMGRRRRIGLVVPSFMLIADILRDSDLIALIPAPCIRDADAQGLATFSPPVPVGGFTLHLGWARRRDSDIVLRHVTATLKALVSDGRGKVAGQL